jgi:hypothetical protein
MPTLSEPGARSARFAAACLVVAAGLGCGPATESIVHGCVTIDGVPVETGMIRFLRPSGGGPTEGAAIEAGRYRAVVRPGPVVVEIQAFRRAGETRLSPDPAAPPVPILEPLRREQVPAIERTLTPGRNALDFAL